jgi:hypothetical protein
VFHNVAGYLQQMDVSDIGRQFSALYLSPFLNAGATFACFQSLGMVPVCIDFVYILVKIGVT